MQPGNRMLQILKAQLKKLFKEGWNNMSYTILIRNEKDPKLFKFLTVKEPVMKEIKTEVTDAETNEVKEVITYEPTGETKTVNYSVTDKQELEDKYISLLDTYNRKQIIPIAIEDYDLDMIFDSDTDSEQ